MCVGISVEGGGRGGAERYDYEILGPLRLGSRIVGLTLTSVRNGCFLSV